MDGCTNNCLKILPDIVTCELIGVTKENSRRIIIPGEPVGKGRPRFTRRGRCYTPKTTEQAERLVQSVGQSQFGGDPMTGPLAVELLAVSSIPRSWSGKKQMAAKLGEVRPARKPDFDNLIKLYCDGLNGIVWEDDKQIVDGRCIKVYGDRPCVLLWFWPV